MAEKWPDESTRELLRARAIEDQDNGVRSAALQSLVEKWPDESTRELLRARAIEDQDNSVRSAAMQSLAEKWPDESTRELLRTRALEDQDNDVRSAALQSLAEKWPDESTRELLRARAIEDEIDSVRGCVFSLLGQMHSRFGKIVGTRDLDGIGPYLDPREPVATDHIQKAAEKARIAPADLQAQISSLNQHLGWDITVGARPTPAPKKAKKKPPRGSGGTA